MQYLLSEEEYNSLTKKAKDASKMPSQADLQTFCTKVADELVLTEGWRNGHTWGCILSLNHEWYCDDCPSQKICPHPDKEWSK